MLLFSFSDVEDKNAVTVGEELSENPVNPQTPNDSEVTQVEPETVEKTVETEIVEKAPIPEIFEEAPESEIMEETVKQVTGDSVEFIENNEQVVVDDNIEQVESNIEKTEIEIEPEEEKPRQRKPSYVPPEDSELG